MPEESRYVHAADYNIIFLILQCPSTCGRMGLKTGRKLNSSLGLFKRRVMDCRMTNEDWEKAKGIECPRCGNHSVRLIKGVCPECARDVARQTEEQIENKAMRNYYQDKLRRGTISLSRMRQGLL